jgi:hypothetical protein
MFHMLLICGAWLGVMMVALPQVLAHPRALKPAAPQHPRRHTHRR